MSDPADDSERLIITIDGPAGTGKTSVSRHLATRLGLACLDTGAMYRAAALLAIEQAIDPADGDVLAEAIRRSDMHWSWSDDPPRLMLGVRDVGERIRDLGVSGIVSIVAAQPAVRAVLVAAQRAVAEIHPRLVSEGRDQGSIVFPDAFVRIYLEAEPDERARRRLRQLEASGRTAKVEDVVEDITTRDHIDSTRADGPLICPEGAVVIDTSNHALMEVVDKIEAIVRARVASERPV